MKRSPTLQATGPSILRIGFDPEQVRKLTADQLQEFVRWHVARVLTGESSATIEWERLGFRVSVRPWEK